MTKISWTDSTWNPVHGCSHAKSPGCDHCYARRMSKRLAGRHGYPPAPDNFKVTLRPDRLEQPLKWRKPHRIFVCSMGDLFHEDVPDEFIDMVFQTIALCNQHTFQILTKRPERMIKYFQQKGIKNKVGKHPLAPFQNRALPNISLGVTVENQAMADKRIPLLLQTPAAMRFVSAEPLLSKVRLGFLCQECNQYYHYSDLFYTEGDCLTEDCKGGYNQQFEELNLVITGGETGPGARPSSPKWFRSLRDQCQAAEIKFHFKQHGEWQGVDQSNKTVGPNTKEHVFNDGTICLRVGNKHAGHLLDGVKHHE